MQMQEKNLFSYYNLSECLDRTKLYFKLNALTDEGKITWKLINDDVITIIDFDLLEDDTNELINLLDDLDAIPDLDIEEDNDDEYFDDEGTAEWE